MFGLDTSESNPAASTAAPFKSDFAFLLDKSQQSSLQPAMTNTSVPIEQQYPLHAAAVTGDVKQIELAQYVDSIARIRRIHSACTRGARRQA